ncbi:MAG: porphobilinogen synthase [Syntrophomonadaceae bacterium]|nr:porphobilinogen synthase [Syntrophomonadaceae bacterium]
MGFPVNRMRRLRSNETIRRMVRETSLSIDDFIYPLFVVYGKNKKIAIPSMPGIFQFSVDKLKKEIKEIKAMNIPAVLLFGIPEHKDSVGTAAYQLDGVVQQASKMIKDSCPEIMIVTDVCLCEYTDHGHCGVFAPNGSLDNDATLEILAKEALSHAQAGADIIAPSDMMDGRIGYIRKCLDENSYQDIPIMAYAAKFYSSFYSPFRDAAESAPQFGDRKSYQMDGANLREALREVALDIEEGADIVMVKPALPYLDVLKAVKDTFAYPTAAYNVSGEYSMIKAGAACGWIDEERVMLEVLTSIKRAGADMIISYFARDVAKIL